VTEHASHDDHLFSPAQQRDVAGPSLDRKLGRSMLLLGSLHAALLACALLAYWLFAIGEPWATMLILLPLATFSLTSAAIVPGALRHNAALHKAGGKLCPHCEYDLSNSAESGPCPECGVPYSPASLTAAHHYTPSPTPQGHKSP
jgi:hypothetical protein